MLKKISLLIISIVLISTLVNISLADKSDYDIFVTPPRIVMFEDETAEYNFTIKNNNDFEERFQNPYASDPDWIITTDPEIDVVSAKSSNTYKLYIRPKAYVLPGQYAITLNIKSLLTEEQRKNEFLIFIKPLNPLPVEYVKSIALNVDMLSNIDPKEDVAVSVYLRNRNAREYKNLTIKMESNLIKKEYNLDFSAIEERTDKFEFQIDKYTPPQTDKLIITIYSDKEVINQVKIPFKIIEYTKVKETINLEESFLRTNTKITLLNEGNIKNNEPYKLKMGFFKDLFTKTTPINTYITKENDERYLNFDTNLNPGETINLNVETDYRFMFYLCIIAIILLTTYYQMRSPVIVKKEAHPHEQSHDGVTDFKVKILVRNRSQKPVENVKVVEMIPSLAVLLKETNVGTIEPSKVMRNDKSGTLVRWDINYLEPFEERIITYKIRSKLNIVGGLTLQPTKVKFETVTGKERVTYSKKHSIKLLH